MEAKNYGKILFNLVNYDTKLRKPIYARNKIIKD